jgi:hypothetical protein
LPKEFAMMMDGKGCAAILVVLAITGLIVGLIAFYLGAPRWAVPVGAFGLPLVIVILFALALAWDALKERIAR